jgi:hypothetical protein
MFGFEGFAGALSQVDFDGVTGLDNVVTSSVAYATEFPDSSFLATTFSTHSNLQAALGGTGATVFGEATQGGSNQSNGAAGAPEYKSTVEWTIDATSLTGHLIAGFIDDEFLGSGFTTLDFTIVVNGTAVVTEHFTTASQANSFFVNNAVDLGLVTSAPNQVVDFNFDLVTASPEGSGFDADFLLGTSGQTAFGARLLGIAQDAEILTAETTGGSPHTLQWQRMVNNKWTNIAGATALTYTVSDADEGHKLRVVATDNAGTKALSLATATVTDAPPELAINSKSLTLPKGGSVDLGVSVLVPDADDQVTVTIKGLTNYESITDNLDHQTFAGRAGAITLTAAQVNSGLTLSSSYTGKGAPTNTLTLTLLNNTTGEVIKGAGQTITVADPPLALLAQYMASAGAGGAGSTDANVPPPLSQPAAMNLVSPGH